MICPHCGVTVGYDPVEYAKEVQIGHPGNWQNTFLASGSIYDEQSGYWFGLARCQSCHKAFPVRGTARDDKRPDHTYVEGSLKPLWPTRYKSISPVIPSPVREAMEDASAALGAGSVIGAMLAARTAMIRAQRWAKKELDLPEASLKALLDAGRISQFEFEASDLARRWAGYLGHEEPDPEKPFDLEDCEEFYGYVEDLLDSLFVKWERLNRQRAIFKGEPGEEQAEQDPDGSQS